MVPRPEFEPSGLGPSRLGTKAEIDHDFSESGVWNWGTEKPKPDDGPETKRGWDQADLRPRLRLTTTFLQPAFEVGTEKPKPDDGPETKSTLGTGIKLPLGTWNLRPSLTTTFLQPAFEVGTENPELDDGPETKSSLGPSQLGTKAEIDHDFSESGV